MPPYNNPCRMVPVGPTDPFGSAGVGEKKLGENETHENGANGIRVQTLGCRHISAEK